MTRMLAMTERNWVRQAYHHGGLAQDRRSRRWHAFRAVSRRTKQQREEHKRRAGELNTALGIEIALRRIGEGISLRRAAALTGLSPSRLRGIQDGDVGATIAEIEACAALFEATVDQLYSAAKARIAEGRMPEPSPEDELCAVLGFDRGDEYFQQFLPEPGEAAMSVDQPD